MKNISVKQERSENTPIRVNRRGKAVLGALAVGAIGAGIVGANAINEKFDQHQEKNYVLDRLHNAGEVERGMTLQFAPGTELLRSPSMTKSHDEQSDNVAGVTGEYILSIADPVVVRGNDDKRYVVTMVPSTETPAPTDIPSLAEQGVLIALDGDTAYTQHVPDGGAVPEMIAGDDLPAGANTVVMMSSASKHG